MTSTVTDKMSIPNLNYALLSSPDTRAVFIQQLQHALFDEVIACLPRVFALPQERKDALCMTNSPHFLGYSRLGVERTKGAADQREQFDIATPLRIDGCQASRSIYVFGDRLRCVCVLV